MLTMSTVQHLHQHIIQVCLCTSLTFLDSLMCDVKVGPLPDVLLLPAPTYWPWDRACPLCPFGSVQGPARRERLRPAARGLQGNSSAIPYRSAGKEKKGDHRSASALPNCILVVVDMMRRPWSRDGIRSHVERCTTIAVCQQTTPPVAQTDTHAQAGGAQWRSLETRLLLRSINQSNQSQSPRKVIYRRRTFITCTSCH